MAIEDIFARTRERKGFAQDVTSLQQFIQRQQQLADAERRLQLIRSLPLAQRQSFQGPVPNFPAFTPFPQAQSQAGSELFGKFLLNQQELGGRAAIERAKPITPTKGSFQQVADPITGRQINALVDPTTGSIIRKFGTTEEGLSVKDKVTVAITQAKEFRADPRIKNLNIIERSERGMAAALKQATSPNIKSRIASDQVLGVLFQKMLDPESVVRESEFARTPEGAAAVNRLLAIAPQLRLGGLRLLDEDRQALVDMARKLLREAKISANRAFDEFSTRADEIGLNKKIVFGGVKKFDVPTEFDPMISQLPQGQQQLITATNPQTGEKIQSFDGGQTWQPIR